MSKSTSHSAAVSLAHSSLARRSPAAARRGTGPTLVPSARRKHADASQIASKVAPKAPASGVVPEVPDDDRAPASDGGFGADADALDFEAAAADAIPAELEPPPASTSPRAEPTRREVEEGGGDSSLARYFREMSVHAVMGQQEELSTAVEVEDAEIGGTIDGTVTARGSLIVRSTGRVLGTARCRRLQVEDGGQITGTIEMITEAARPDSPRPATDA